MTSKIKVDNINKVSDDSNIIKKCGSTITLGASGDSIALASGATQTGFGRSGSVNWQTGSIKTTTFTPTNGEGYFVDTSSGAVTANLPAGSAGAIVAFSDYTRTFGINNLTIAANGAEKIGGLATDLILNVSGQALTLVYVDGTEGWINVQNAEDTETGSVSFMAATGGTITTDGDFKVHTFTGPGTFCVSQTSTVCSSRNIVAYVTVAGGAGGGAGCAGGGGGAGGFREGRCSSVVPYTASPLVSPTGITVSTQAYPITVGSGGTGGVYPSTGATDGGVSTFSTITSAGGGRAGGSGTPIAGGNGGSGGGGAHHPGAGGTGNTPSVSPPQGQNGGASSPGSSPSGDDSAGSGGGAGGVGATGGPFCGGGGSGVATSITGSPVTRAGGGGGGDRNIPGQSPGIHPGGSGGGGNSGGSTSYPRPAADGNGNAGTVNTGGGGGGGVRYSPSASPGRGSGAAGGSGIVIIRYKFQ